MIRDVALALLLGAAAVGCAYLAAVVWLVTAFARRDRPVSRFSPAVTVLKPLHGDEPGLFDNLASFCRQNYSGPMQIVFGVADPADPAVDTVERLRTTFPERDIELVVDPRRAGSNPKVANLINMSARIRHEIVIVADSDIRVRPDYLAGVVAAIERNAGGGITCLYYGIAGGSLWSQLARLQIDGHFLPGVVAGLRLRLAQPCLGSTIAMRASTLSSIGGFAAVADTLADDYEIGAALRRRGEPVAVAPFAVGHICGENSFRALWRREIRWASTIRLIDPVGYAGWIVTNPLPFALLAVLLGAGAPAVALAGAACIGRAAVLAAVARAFQAPGPPYWLVPVRDLLSIATYFAGFAARNLDWRGRRYTITAKAAGTRTIQDARIEGAMKSERRSRSS
jgi:ceramide glucosyltransferase